MEEEKEPTSPVPPVGSRLPTIGDLVIQGLYAFFIGALLGVAYHFSVNVLHLFG
jgi:hypothetical protein